MLNIIKLVVVLWIAKKFLLGDELAEKISEKVKEKIKDLLK